MPAYTNTHADAHECAQALHIPTCPRDDGLDATLVCVAGIVHHQLWRAVRAHNVDFRGDAKVLEHLGYDGGMRVRHDGET